MARKVSVGTFQHLQQRQQPTGHLNDADPFAIDPAAEDAAAAARLKEIGCGSVEPKAEDRIDERLGAVSRSMSNAVSSGVVAAATVDQPADDSQHPKDSAFLGVRSGETAEGAPSDVPAVFSDSPRVQPDAMTRLVTKGLNELDIGTQCTAEMSLHMITERVRDAVLETDWGKLATDAEIVAEAERIWVSLDRQRSHTYSVDADGSVRDWRRPDTTPDRGPDVGTNIHQVGEEQRFSGAGAEGGQQASMFPVPTDAQFNGRQYREAPELANIAERLISEHGFLEQLENCDVRWYWKRKTGVSKGRVKIGFMKRASDLLGHFSGADFIGWLSATTARDGKFTDEQVTAAVFHQLCHIGSDDSGNWIFAPHDFEGFAAEVRVFGTWTSDLKLGGNAFVAAHQMGLFTDEDDREEAARAGYVETPDGAGVLIHADGSPLTDAEIEAMERRELDDDDTDPDDGDDDDVEAFDAQEDGDPLADVDL